jgi:hypothetical protein
MLYKTKYLIMFSLFFTLYYLPVIAQNKSTLKQLALDSDVILAGKVLAQSSDWNKDKSRIYTTVTIEVDEYLKGNINERSIKVKHPGGEVDDVGELYSHMPKFSNDEEVLLFTKINEDGNNYKVVNGEEGKLTIYWDQRRGEKITSSNKKVSELKNEIKSYVEQK